MAQRARGVDLKRTLAVFGLSVFLSIFLSACASEPEEDDTAALLGYSPPNDPIESVNRDIFDFNMRVDRAVLKPAAEAYADLPPDLRDMVRNLIRYAGTPVLLANNVLQGDIDGVGNTSARFFLNTFTLGMGDIAAAEGYPYRVEDFGQTLGTWGSDEQFYLVLPLLGPSSGRDALGLVADIFLNPLFYVDGTATTAYGASSTVVAGIDLRAQNLGTLEELERDSVDFYARMRSLYLQRRDAQISNSTEGMPAGPGFPGEE